MSILKTFNLVVLIFNFNIYHVRYLRSNKVRTDIYREDGLPPMEYVESEKDIEVVIDNKLTFNQHISEKINKANSIMGVFRRTMEYMDCTTFKLLYIQL